MADPWIRMRINLAQDSTVLSLGLSLGTSAGLPPEVPRRVRRRVAVGLLLETWGLFHLEADPAGLLAGYTLADLDEHVGVDGWGQTLVDVGWVAVSDAGVTASGFDRWIGSKKANQERERSRKRAQRAASGVSHPLSHGTTPGTSRGTSAGRSSSLSSSSSSLSEGEPEREAAPPPDPREEQALDLAVARAEAQLDRTIIGRPLDPLVEPVARAWVVYRAEIGSPLARSSLSAFLRDLEVNPEAMARRVSHAISNGYKGLPEPSAASGPAGPPRRETANQAATRRALEALEYMERALGDRPAIEDHATPRLCP